MSNDAIDTDEKYDATKIRLSTLALDGLIDKDGDFADLAYLRGKEGLFRHLPSRTKGKIKEILTMAMAEPHFDEVIHTGGATFQDLEVIKDAVKAGVEVKAAISSYNKYALVNNLHPNSKSWHVLHLRLHSLEGGKVNRIGLIPPGELTEENLGFSRGRYYLSIPSSPEAKSKYAFVWQWIYTVEEASERIAHLLD